MAFTSISMTLEEQLKAMSGWGTLKPMNPYAETTVKDLVLDQDTKDLIKGGMLFDNMVLTPMARAELERALFETHKTKLLEKARENIKESEQK